jgi:hypothetical protein
MSYHEKADSLSELPNPEPCNQQRYQGTDFRAVAQLQPVLVPMLGAFTYNSRFYNYTIRADTVAASETDTTGLE